MYFCRDVFFIIYIMKFIMSLLATLMMMGMASGQPVDALALRHAVELQLADYPASTLQDIYKNFYQEHFGPEHMISNVEAVNNYLLQELKNCEDDACRLYYEPIGANGDYVRVHLRAIADGLITAQQLLDAFVQSANARPEPRIEWNEKWQLIVNTIKGMDLKIDGLDNDLETLLEASLRNQAVHHSRKFNEAYHPHYRIVERHIFESQLKPLIDR